MTGPDRTASPPTETPSSPRTDAYHHRVRGRATATDTPVPAATTAPPAASGSAETDREALVAIYNTTDGENWINNYNWLSDAPLGEWQGVYTNDDGRVRQLNLYDNELSGEIPPELGSLSNLDGLAPQRQRLERGDTGGTGQPLQPERYGPRKQRLERGDTGGAGQPLQPERAAPLQTTS